MFKIGDKVTWSSQSGGSTTSKTGIVVAIVQLGIDPSRIQFLKGAGIATLSRRFDGGPRQEISYLVAVRPGKTDKSSPVVYWPRVQNLRLK